MDSVSRRTVMVGTLGIAGAAVVGCSAQPPGGSQTPAPSASPTPSVDTTPRWPLTGKPLAAGDDPKHIAVAVKASASIKDPPNRGLNDADIVFVECDAYHDSRTGESETRLVPVFHTTYAKQEGTVRSMRPVDAPLLAPITGIIGSTGAFDWVKRYMAAFDKYLVTKWEDAAVPGDAYIHDPSVAPWRGVIAQPRLLAKLTKEFQDGPQQPYLPWAANDAEVSTLKGQPAASIAIPWMERMKYEVKYTWDEKKGLYLRSQPWGKHVLKDGSRVTADNVIIIFSETLEGRITPAGKITKGGSHAERVYKIINASGKFYYAQGGKYVAGTWTKGEVNEPFAFTLDDGSPLKVAPGRTYIELPTFASKVRFAG